MLDTSVNNSFTQLICVMTIVV